LREAVHFASNFLMKRNDDPAAMPQHCATPSCSKAPKKAVSEVPRAVYSIPEFCEAHRICEAFYSKLRAACLGPRYMRT
jgi:hypothetical protein